MAPPLINLDLLLHGLSVTHHSVHPGLTQRYLTPLLKTGLPALQSPVGLYSPPVSGCAVAAAPCRLIVIAPHTEGRKVVTVNSGSECHCHCTHSSEYRPRVYHHCIVGVAAQNIGEARLVTSDVIQEIFLLHPLHRQLDGPVIPLGILKQIFFPDRVSFQLRPFK